MTDTKQLPSAPPHPSLLSGNPELAKEVDDRVSLEKKSSQWIFEDANSGTEYSYNFILEKWIPRSTEKSDDITNNKRVNSADDEEQNKMAIKRIKKEKLQAMKDEIRRLKGSNRTDADNSASDSKQSNNSIYVSNLPSDITKEELVEVFSKYGIIAEDIKTGDARVKLYYDEKGVFKNEALILYLSEDSVPLAIEMLHDSPISAKGPKIKVERAQFNAKSTPKRVLTVEEKRLLTQRKEMLKRKLTDWDDTAESTEDKSAVIKQKIWSKIVVARNMFREDELKSDPSLEMDLNEDIQEECDKFDIGNDITNVKVYDISGVITIKFKKAELAEKCIEVFGGRFFDGLKLIAERYNGQQFETSKIEDEESERVKNFGDWIERQPQNVK